MNLRSERTIPVETGEASGESPQPGTGGDHESKHERLPWVPSDPKKAFAFFGLALPVHWPPRLAAQAFRKIAATAYSYLLDGGIVSNASKGAQGNSFLPARDVESGTPPRRGNQGVPRNDQETSPPGIPYGFDVTHGGPFRKFRKV